MNVQRLANTAAVAPAPVGHAGGVADPAVRPASPDASARNQQGSAASAEFMRAARELRDAVGPAVQTYAQYHVDRDTRAVQVQIVDQTSGQVVRQIPAEALVRFAKAWDAYVGNLLDRGT